MDLALYKVLIIEDDFLVAEDMKHVVEEAHCLVIGPVRNEKEALDMIENEIPDIAVVDLNLGDGMSTSVPRLLRLHNIPFCFATGYDQAAVPAEFRDVPYLRKPVEKDDLLKVLWHVLN
jgi:two-component SAPR family response regulator